MPKKSEQNTNNILPFKKGKPILEKQSIKSIDGFNLAEFSLSPLSYQTKALAHQKVSFEWEQQMEGHESKKCFFKLSYGETPPNANTEDYLLLLLYLAQLKENPLCVETSFYEIMKTKGIDYKPNKQQTQAIVRHLDALMDLKIETNFIYNRKTKRWNKGIKTRVITSYEYKTKEYTRTRLIHSKDGSSSKKSVEDVYELEQINFDPTFYKYFVKDAIEFDLATYFSLENPTPKRLYRFGNKYVNNLGTFGIDLVHFCITRLGMKKSYVDSFSYVSKLSAKLKPHIKRVNETVENMEISIKKNKGEPSGYKITFNKSDQLQLPINVSSFTNSEKKSYEILVKNGIYPTPARKIVTKLRTHLGKKSTEYVFFVIRKFKVYQKKATLKIDQSKQGAILLKAFENSWYFPDFMEWYSKKQKKEEQEEIARYGNLFEQHLPKSLNSSSSSKKKVSFGERFNIKIFKEKHKKVFDMIYQAQQKSIHKAVVEHGLEFITMNKRKTVEQIIMNRVETYCEQCFKQWKKGNEDFLPSMYINLNND